MGCVDLAEAATWNGDPTVVPAPGDVTVTCAPAIPAKKQAVIKDAIRRPVNAFCFLVLSRSRVKSGGADRLK